MKICISMAALAVMAYNNQLLSRLQQATSKGSNY